MSTLYKMQFVRDACYAQCTVPTLGEALPGSVPFVPSMKRRDGVKSCMQLHNLLLELRCRYRFVWFAEQCSLFSTALPAIGLYEYDESWPDPDRCQSTTAEWHDAARLAFCSIGDAGNAALGAFSSPMDTWVSDRFPEDQSLTPVPQRRVTDLLVELAAKMSNLPASPVTASERQLAALFEYLPVNEMIPSQDPHEAITWLVYLGPRLAELYGQDALLSGPFFRAEARPTGAVVVDLTPGVRLDHPSRGAWSTYTGVDRARQFLRLDEDWRARYLELRERLGLPLAPE